MEAWGRIAGQPIPVVASPTQYPPHMKPKFRYPVAEKATIPEHLLPHYVEKDGVLTLDIDGAGDAVALNRKLDEFRTNNQNLRQDVEEVAAAATGKDAGAFKGVEKATIIAEVTASVAAAATAGSAKTKQEIETASEAKITAQAAAHKREVDRLTAEHTAARKELSELKIDKAVLDEATRLGLRPEANPDVMARARSIFTLDDKGNPVARGADGSPLFDQTTGNPLCIAAWTKQLSGTAPHLFKESAGPGGGEAPPAGGGAGGGAGGAGGGGRPPGAAGGVNPWNPKTINRTKQSEMYRTNKPLAIKMAAEHGVTLPP